MKSGNRALSLSPSLPPSLPPFFSSVFSGLTLVRALGFTLKCKRHQFPKSFPELTTH
jgi:hypothetical protein